MPFDECFREKSKKYNDSLRSGEYADAVLNLYGMQTILLGESRYEDTLKCGMIQFFLNLNGAAGEPKISEMNCVYMMKAASCLNMSDYELRQMFLDISHEENAPKRMVTAGDAVFLLELCINGDIQTAQEILKKLCE